MHQSLRVQDIVLGQTPEPEHRSELQDLAISLSSKVQNLLGQKCKEELLSTPSNVAPVFLKAKVDAQGTEVTHGPNWQQQAQLTINQAATLSSALGVLFGEESCDLYSNDCLTTGALSLLCKTCILPFASASLSTWMQISMTSRLEV